MKFYLYRLGIFGPLNFEKRQNIKFDITQYKMISK